MKIHILDKSTIDKIAAGEVVERPANVIKELMENSIDSGADSISVEIKDGGKSLIRVTDNGCGIAKDQIRTAFQRHATSKIRNAEDLSFIHTLGFRGEALSSIAAVSVVEMCTKTPDAFTGSIYKMRYGEEISFEEAGLPDGTTVILRDLFGNVPARLKFLGSAQSEGSSVTDTVEKIALSHPDVAIKFTNNGSVRLSTSGNGSLKDCIYAVFGREMASSILKVDYSGELLCVSGYVGKPEIQRSNRSYENFFVNGRFVKDKILSASVENAFKGYQMKGSYPFALLNITIEPELMDVNVHPAKLEIRFFNNEAVYNEINKAISDVLQNRTNIPEFTVKTDLEKTFEKENVQREETVFKTPVPEPFEYVRRELVTPSAFREETVYEPVQEEVFSEPFLSPAAKSRHVIIGQIFDTYWIIEYDNKMYIIDQHAAHEKVNYERFMNRIKNGEIQSQLIMPGILVTLSAREEECLLKYYNRFIELGFEIEHFGGRDYMIKAVPYDLHGIQSADLFISFLDELNENPASSDPDILTDRIATAACKASVKGGDRLSVSEADNLIAELLTLENPYNCPHGRPTMITMSKYELEKKFKRII